MSLETTQIYTQLSIRKLKEIYTATYPAKMMLAQRQEQETELDKDGLFSAFAAEEVEEDIET